MKKWLCLLLAGVLTFSLAACGRGQNTDPSDAVTGSVSSTENAELTSPNQSAAGSEAVFTKVYGAYTYTITGTQATDKILTITDKASGKTIQALHFSGNEWFTKDPLYLVDVTFDGNLDILIPYQRPASAAYFQAYVWQESEDQFVYAPQFENLPNFAIDKENKCILSTRTASQITSYSISYYDAEAKDFRPSHSIYWEPDTSNNKMHFVEQQYKNGTTVTVKDCLVEKIGDMDINKSDPQVAECFAVNSFWDLDNQKWKDQFYKPSQSGATAGAYAEFLIGYATDKSLLYFTKDIDNNGTEELFIRQNTAMEVYTYEGSVKKVGTHDFITGTLKLYHTMDKKYPGIVFATAGGGKEHFGYITITNGELEIQQTFDIDFGMISGEKEDVFYTQDEDLIAVSRKAYQYNYQIGYSTREPKPDNNTEDVQITVSDAFIASCNMNAGGYINFLNGKYYYRNTADKGSLYMSDADGKNAICVDNCPGATLSAITVDETAVYYLKLTKLDTPLENHHFAVSYSIPYEGQLRRYCDGKVTVLSEENVVDYALSKDYIFYTTADMKVYRMKHDGTEKTAIIESTYPNICVSENKLYTHMGEGVRSTDFDGKNGHTVRAYHLALVASESAVCFIGAGDGSLYKMSLNGETIQKVISDPIRSFTVYNGRLVYERMYTNDIVIADMDGSNPKVVCPGASPIALNGHLFYLDNGVIKVADI